MQTQSTPDILEQSEQRHQLNVCLSNLNGKERQAVVLHYLEGMTQREAAVVCSCTEEALRKRLSRALDKLRNLPTKRGVALSAAGCIGLLTAESAKAAPETILTACKGLAIKGCISSTAATGAASAASSGATTSPALQAATGTMKAMFVAKVKTVACVALLTTAGLTGAGLSISNASSQPTANKINATVVSKTETDKTEETVTKDGGILPEVPLGKEFIMTLSDNDYICDLEKNLILHGDAASEVYGKAIEENPHKEDRQKRLVGFYEAYTKTGIDISSS